MMKAMPLGSSFERRSCPGHMALPSAEVITKSRASELVQMCLGVAAWLSLLAWLFSLGGHEGQAHSCIRTGAD